MSDFRVRKNISEKWGDGSTANPSPGNPHVGSSILSLATIQHQLLAISLKSFSLIAMGSFAP